MKKLSELNVGEWAIIKGVEGPPALKRRLETMGFVPGVRVRVTRCAPMGDPRAYELLGYCLSLRQVEAALVMVEPLKVYPLNQAPAGRLKVIDIGGGRGMREKLAQLGVVEEAVVFRQADDGTGPVVVEVAEGRKFQIGWGMAGRIMVMKATDDNPDAIPTEVPDSGASLKTDSS